MGVNVLSTLGNTPGGIAVGGLAVAVGAYACYRAYGQLGRAADAFFATETTVADVLSEPRDWVGERVLVAGTASELVERKVVARAAGRRCQAATTVTERYAERDLTAMRRSGWRPSGRSLEWVPFAVDDGSGHIEVEPPSDAAAFSSHERFETALDLRAVTVSGVESEREGGYAAVVDTAVESGDAPSMDSRTVATDGGAHRVRQGTLRDGDEITVVATVTERFGNVFLTAGEDPDRFRLVADGRPGVRRPGLVGAATALVGLAALAAGAWFLSPLIP